MRFDLNMRLQHLVLLVTFFIQVITGFPLTFSDQGWAHALVDAMGGWEVRTILHRTSGVVMVIAGAYHVIHFALFKLDQRKMLPRIRDITDFLQYMKHCLGMGEEPKYDRYSWKEKFEYFGVVWGTLLMGATGLIMMYPFVALEVMPYGWINLARIVHLYEALLATLVVFIWHFYNVHFHASWRFQATWLTGRIPEDKMREHHPLEYEEVIKTMGLEKSAGEVDARAGESRGERTDEHVAGGGKSP